MKIDKKVLYKSISYRICITLVTAAFTGWHTAFWLALIGTFLYYIHDEIWKDIDV